MVKRLFLDHPAAIGEGYREHFVAASGFGLSLIGAGLACLVHAIIPGCFVATASDVVERLHDVLVRGRRDRLRRCEAPPAVDAAE